MQSIIGPTSSLGSFVDYSLAPRDRIKYLKKHTPTGLDSNELLRVFKKDIYIDLIIEVLSDVDVFYIQFPNDKSDELYYFRQGSKLFHGDKVWSSYHNFLPHLADIKPSAYVSIQSWFVGSRPNYTHQLIDFLPSILLQEYDSSLNTQKCLSQNIFGSPNSILESLKELKNFRMYLNRPHIYLESLGSVTSLGSLNIRCIRFKSLYLIKHMSVFKAFWLLNKALSPIIPKNVPSQPITNRLLYLSRSDDRVSNQSQILSFLNQHPDATVLDNIHELSYAEKAMLISKYNSFVLPPGSDNINALCFSSPTSSLIQMIPVPLPRLLESPFHSYAGLRYLLPFLHRLSFWPCSHSQNLSVNGGSWSIPELEAIIGSTP